MNKERFLAKLEEFATSYNDTVGQGVTRFSWTKTACLAQSWLEKEFSRLGISLIADGFGNLRALYKGKTNEPRIIIGSHLDTVRNGAKYDGALGLVASLEIIRSFKEEGYIPKRSIEFIAFAEEEGANFGTTCLGSKVITGMVQPESLKQLSHDTSTAWDVLEDFGLEPENLVNEQINPKDVYAYLELHVEQEKRLQKLQQKLGVVMAISAMRLYKVVYRGESVFAATPMKERKDPVHSFVECHQEIQNAFNRGEFPENTRFTVGQIQCNPGTGIVVPSECIFSIDVRNLHIENLEGIWQKIEKIILDVAKKNGIGVEISPLSQSGGVPMSDKIQSMYKESATELGFSFAEINCGTSFDVAPMAKVVPAGLLLVQNQEDSLTKEKYALAQDMLDGAEVYERTLRKLAEE